MSYVMYETTIIHTPMSWMAKSRATSTITSFILRVRAFINQLLYGCTLDRIAGFSVDGLRPGVRVMFHRAYSTMPRLSPAPATHPPTSFPQQRLHNPTARAPQALMKLTPTGFRRVQMPLAGRVELKKMRGRWRGPLE